MEIVLVADVGSCNTASGMGLEYERKSGRVAKRLRRRRAGDKCARKKDSKLGRQREEHHWYRKGHRIHEGISRSDRADGDVKMMSTGLFMLMFTSGIAAEPTDDLKRDMKALALFLQDQEDHKNHCPKLEWKQPDISIYKETLKSQLPDGCKK